MSNIGAYVRMLFGGSVAGDANARASAGSNQQNIFESVTTTTSRVMKGPQVNGQYSLHIRLAAGTAPVGTLTVWYSNMVDPDPTNDQHWVQDSNISAIDLSVIVATFLNVSLVAAEHVRVKVTRTSGTIAINVFGKSEGVD